MSTIRYHTRTAAVIAVVVFVKHIYQAWVLALLASNEVHLPPTPPRLASTGLTRTRIYVDHALCGQQRS